MSSPRPRTRSILLLCVCLPGCAVGIASTNLKNLPARSEDTELLQSVGFVIHSTTGSGSVDDGKDRTSWAHALAGLASMENIFIFRADGPEGMIHSYAEFSKTHPMVTIELRVTDPGDNFGAFLVLASLVSLGTVPAYYSEPDTATFSLAMPAEEHVPDLHWNYGYRRRLYLWDPFLPIANYMVTQAGSGSEIDPRWKAEEKRRLLLRFLQDARQPLREYFARVRRAP
jgi:hypothetical protein